MRLTYHPAAEAELVKAARFYERKVPSLGSQFLDAVDRAAAVILKTPERFRIIEAEVRKVSLRRFPYAIYYRMVSGQIRILAVKHHSRHPGYWRARLSE